MNKKNTLLIFGFGYTAKFMCQNFSKKNWEVFCTTRFDEKIKEIKSLNVTPIFFDDEKKIKNILNKESYILSTVPPEEGKDPVIENYGYLFKRGPKKWNGMEKIVPKNMFFQLCTRDHVFFCCELQRVLHFQQSAVPEL